MKVIETQGAFRVMGQAMGEALREEIQAHVALGRIRAALEDPVKRARMEEYKRVTAKAMGELYDELVGTAEGAFDLGHMQAILRHHGEPGVCRHGEYDGHHTEYSMIGLPASGRMLYYHGPPCRGEYKEIGVG